jgi:hypothetical protein
MLDGGQTLGAHGAPGEGIRVAFDMDDNAVLHCHLDAAAAVAAFTGSINNFAFRHRFNLFF